MSLNKLTQSKRKYHPLCYYQLVYSYWNCIAHTVMYKMEYMGQI